REYTLLSVLPRDVADAYLSGDIHFELLGSWILKPDIVQHDIRLMLTGRFQGLPTRKPKTMLSALNRLKVILCNCSLEVNMEQGLDMFNVFLSHFVRGRRMSDLRGVLRMFIESLRLRSGVNINLGLEVGFTRSISELRVPEDKKEVYGGYEDEALMLANALIDVLKREFSRSPIENLSLTVKIRTNYSKAGWLEVLRKAHDLVGLSMPVLFVNMTDVEGNIGFSSQGLRFAPSLDWEAETLAVPMISGVSINTPRLAYISRGDDDRFWENVSRVLDKALMAIEIRRKALNGRIKEGLLSTLLSPEEPYVRFEAMFSALGLIGLNEAAVLHTGSDLLNPSSQSAMLKLLRMALSYIGEAEDKVGLTSICGEEGASRLVNLD
ncbi:MAG TPA: hypothetical protein EYP90_08265, partial [Chromatiaceae bacterium]|nr:hypothetical protein [Chromatiaceae bacterium]